MTVDWKERHAAFYTRYRILPRPEKPGEIVVKGEWVVAVWFNCYGKGIPVEYYDIGSTHWALLEPACAWAYPEYTCIREWGWKPTDGMLIDRRELKALMAGCCPPEITNEMLGTVEMPT